MHSVSVPSEKCEGLSVDAVRLVVWHKHRTTKISGRAKICQTGRRGMEGGGRGVCSGAIKDGTRTTLSFFLSTNCFSVGRMPESVRRFVVSLNGQFSTNW